MNRKQKFFNQIKNNNNFVIISVPNYSNELRTIIKYDFQKINFNLQMSIKRLIHKLFIGERKKNEKTIFKNNIYILTAQENPQYNLINFLCKKHKIDIQGICNDKQLMSNYQTIININFSKEQCIALLIKILLMPLFFTVHHSNKIK